MWKTPEAGVYAPLTSMALSNRFAYCGWPVERCIERGPVNPVVLGRFDGLQALVVEVKGQHHAGEIEIGRYLRE